MLLVLLAQSRSKNEHFGSAHTTHAGTHTYIHIIIQYYNKIIIIYNIIYIYNGKIVRFEACQKSVCQTYTYTSARGYKLAESSEKNRRTATRLKYKPNLLVIYANYIRWGWSTILTVTNN